MGDDVARPQRLRMAKSLRMSVDLTGLSGHARAAMIRQELMRAKETHPMRIEAKLMVRNFRRSEKPSMQRKHHACVLSQRDRIQDILDRVQIKLDSDTLPFHFGEEDREYVLQWIEDIEFILHYFRPQADPRNDPLGRMVDKLYWLHQSYACFAAIGHDAKAIIDDWDSLGMFENDAFSDDSDDDETMQSYATLCCDAIELDAAAETHRKRRVVRRRAAARVIRRNILHWLTTKHHVVSRMEEFRHFGNSFYKHIDNRRSLLQMSGRTRPRAPQRHQGMRLDGLQRLCRHVATFKVDDAIRHVEIAIRKRRLFEARCAVRIQSKWRSYKLGQSRIMRLIRQLQVAQALEKRPSRPALPSKPTPPPKSRDEPSTSSASSIESAGRTLLVNETASSTSSGTSALARGRSTGPKKHKTRLRSIVDKMQAPSIEPAGRAKNGGANEKSRTRRSSITPTPTQRVSTRLQGSLINAPTEVRRGMGVVREEPIEDESGNEERVADARQKPARRMSVTARLVQAASKQVQGPLSRRKSRSSKQDPWECAEGDLEARSALDSEEDEGITAWSSETTNVAMPKQAENRPVGDQRPPKVGNARTLPSQSTPSQPPLTATRGGAARQEIQTETQRAIEEAAEARSQSASEDTLPTTTSPKGDIRRQGTSAGRPPVPSFRPLYTAGGGSLRLPNATCAPPVAKKWSPFGDPVVVAVAEEPLKPMYELLRGVDDAAGDQELQYRYDGVATASNAPEMATDSLELLDVATLKLQRDDGLSDHQANWQLQRDGASNQATNDASLSEMEYVPIDDKARQMQSSEVELQRAQALFVSDESADPSHRAAKISLLKAVDSSEEGRPDDVDGNRNLQATAANDTSNVLRKGVMPSIRAVTEVRRLVFSAASPPESVVLPKWTNSVGGKSWRSATPRRSKPPTERRCFLPPSTPPRYDDAQATSYTPSAIRAPVGDIGASDRAPATFSDPSPLEPCVAPASPNDTSSTPVPSEGASVLPSIFKQQFHDRGTPRNAPKSRLRRRFQSTDLSHGVADGSTSTVAPFTFSAPARSDITSILYPAEEQRRRGTAIDTALTHRAAVESGPSPVGLSAEISRTHHTGLAPETPRVAPSGVPFLPSPLRHESVPLAGPAAEDARARGVAAHGLSARKPRSDAFASTLASYLGLLYGAPSKR